MGDHPLHPASSFGAPQKGGETAGRQFFGTELAPCIIGEGSVPRLLVLGGLQAFLPASQVVSDGRAISAEYEGHEFVGPAGGAGEEPLRPETIFHLLGGHGYEGRQAIDAIVGELDQVVLYFCGRAFVCHGVC